MGKRLERCGDCQTYEQAHHNYCRMCGYEFRPGQVKFVRIAVAYFINEKYCGSCGALRDDCKC